MANILILGATSAIAQEVARCFAEERGQLYLMGRKKDRLESIAEDLRIRGAAKVVCKELDLTETQMHEEALKEAGSTLGGIDVALLAYGVLPDQKKCETSFEEAEEALHTNFTSCISWLTHLANRMEKEGKGCIAVISSVAGERGRGSNYVYGASKGGLSLFTQGLRSRLFKSGVTVLTIKPGFVDTPMTAHLRKGVLFASPKKVGKDIYRAIQKKKAIIHSPRFWRIIMWIIRLIPERIFRRLSI